MTMQNDKPIHVAIRTKEEWFAFVGLPGDCRSITCFRDLK
jgi:hypothetical protein